VADEGRMAYIDSEIAKRRFEGLQSPLSQTQTTSHSHPHTQAQPAVGSITAPPGIGNGADPTLTRQPATIGKLQEIDLGDEARNLNVQRTQKAQRLLNGELVESDAEATSKPAKVRLGPDGKPWRGRKRRGSEDVKRDRIVEEVLRENGLGIYELPTAAAATDYQGIEGGDEAADERIAEAFRRDFMDAVGQRQRKKQQVSSQPATRGVGGKKEEEVLKGPKLGGSRNARAAMRDSMLKAAGVKK
jgi:hypothetical protein